MTQLSTSLEKYQEAVRCVGRLERRLESGRKVVADVRRAIYPHTCAARLLARRLGISYDDAKEILDDVERDAIEALTVFAVGISRAARRDVLRTYGDPGDGKLGERVKSQTESLRVLIVEAVRSSDEHQLRAYESAGHLGIRLANAEKRARSLGSQLRRARFLDASVPVRTDSLQAELAVVFVEADALFDFLSGTPVQLAVRSRLQAVRTDIGTLSSDLRHVVRTPLAPLAQQELRQRGGTVATGATPGAPRVGGAPGSMLSVALWIVIAKDRDRYAEEWGAEMLHVHRQEQLRHVLGLVRAAFVLRIRGS